MSFEQQVVWITGASSGIGEALVYAFASRGAKVVLSARNEAALRQVCQKSRLSEENSLILPMDLSHMEKAEELTQAVMAKFGRIDVLVNNGGISQRAYAKDTPLEIDRRLFEVNFFGTIALTKSVLPVFLKQRSGHYIVISSISGKFGFFLRSAYAASKHALHGFFESLRLEVFKENIQVLIVCPGKIQTNISLHALTGDGATHNKMDESQQKGIPADECAEQIVKAVMQGKEEIFIGGKEIRAVWVKRFFPSLFSMLIRKQKAE
jgi:dehydrogenase/reductase SDR family member 7B